MVLRLEQCFLITLGTVPSIQPLIRRWRHRNEYVKEVRSQSPSTPSRAPKHRPIVMNRCYSIPPIEVDEVSWPEVLLEISGKSHSNDTSDPERSHVPEQCPIVGPGYSGADD